jgi:hypothetical protein
MTIELGDALAAGVVLDSYMRKRAEAEGVTYALSPEFLAAYYYAGVREFFGVTLDWSTGTPMIDNDEQNPAFVEEWVTAPRSD